MHTEVNPSNSTANSQQTLPSMNIKYCPLVYHLSPHSSTTLELFTLTLKPVESSAPIMKLTRLNPISLETSTLAHRLTQDSVIVSTQSSLNTSQRSKSTADPHEPPMPPSMTSTNHRYLWILMNTLKRTRPFSSDSLPRCNTVSTNPFCWYSIRQTATKHWNQLF